MVIGACDSSTHSSRRKSCTRPSALSCPRGKSSLYGSWVEGNRVSIERQNVVLSWSYHVTHNPNINCLNPNRKFLSLGTLSEPFLSLYTTSGLYTEPAMSHTSCTIFWNKKMYEWALIEPWEQCKCTSKKRSGRLWSMQHWAKVSGKALEKKNKLCLSLIASN